MVCAFPACTLAPPRRYNKGMDNIPDYTSDLPDNFEQEWEDWRDEPYEDDWYHDASVWESAYGPADDGGWAF